MRKMQALVRKVKELSVSLENLENCKQKLRSDLEQANHALALSTCNQAKYEERAKNWKTTAIEMRLALAKLQAEKDAMDREGREREAQLNEEIEEKQRVEQQLAEKIQDLEFELQEAWMTNHESVCYFRDY
ncbi:MHC class II transactivator [Cichlidogyrus casuarinus]|uniref:MHC class II transactivator n=1 Tax=Cichlidogyrus casuarinus TaxID=1844966 RepID=A0ABD2PLW3_9PLAT